MDIKDIAFDVIKTFPQNPNGKRYLTMKNGKRLFFSIFIKKYGLDGSFCKYSEKDVARRIRLVEFFYYITKNYDLMEKVNEEIPTFFIQTKFYRMVIRKIGKKGKQRFELLSFYNFR